MKCGNKTTTDVFIFNNQIFVSAVGGEVMELRNSLVKFGIFPSKQAYFISTLNKDLILVARQEKVIAPLCLENLFISMRISIKK